MNAEAKAKFIRDLIGNVQTDIMGRIPDMPEEWDGHELRAYIAERFAAAMMTVGTKRPEYRRATRAFRSALIERNL